MTTDDHARTNQPPGTDDLRLDEATRLMRETSLPPAATREAMDRAWAGLVAAASPDPACASFRGDLAAHRDGTLTAARRLLAVSHSRECTSCHRSLSVLPDFGAGIAAAAPPRARTRRRWPLAAGIAASIGLLSTATLLLRPHDPGGEVATVAALEGKLLTDGDGSLAEGGALEAGQSIRTAKDSWATLVLGDGSRLELNERSEVALHPDGDALTIDLARGDIIVTAARRPSRNLFVRTDDCTVAVKGTVFAVGHGLKGSRVGVLEGEVHVQDGRTTHVLRRGDQVATRVPLLERDLADQVSWSRSAGHYIQLLDELRAVEASLRAEPLVPNVRHGSALLDAMPAGTVLYAALPNTPGNLERTVELFRERLNANPELQRWWQQQAQESLARGEPSFDELLERVQRVSAALGDEIAIALVLPPAADGVGDSPVPVLVAEITDESALRDVIEGDPAAAARRGGASFPRVIGAADLRREAASGAPDGARVVLDGGHVLAGISPRMLVELTDNVAGARGAFVGTDFHRMLAEHYRRGTEFIFAADLGRLVEVAMGARPAPADGGGLERDLRLLGMGSLDHFVVTAGGSGSDRAVLSFKEARQGIASWLAEPAAMGSLDFVSPEATALVSLVVKDPRSMLDDIRLVADEGPFAAGLEKFAEETGLDLAADVAAPLGGEITLALDGPLLPSPSWKLVVEVYDPLRLQQTLERLVERLNAWQAGQPTDGTPRRPVTLTDLATTEGRFHVLSHPDLRSQVYYVFRDGYLIACPDRSLLESTLQLRELGVSFAASPTLATLLPKDDQDDFSFLAYQDLGAALAPYLPSGANGGLDLAAGQASGTACLAFGRASQREIAFSVTSPGGGTGARIARLLRETAFHALLHELVTQGSPPDSATEGTAAPPAP